MQNLEKYMPKIKRYAAIFALVVWDFFAFSGSVLLAFKMRYPVPEYGIPVAFKETLLIYFFVGSAIIILANIVLGCYTVIWRHISFKDVIKQFVSVLISGTICVVLDHVFKPASDHNVPAIVAIMTFAFVMVFMLLARSIPTLLNSASNKLSGINNSDSKRVLVFGAGEAGIFFQQKCKNHPEDLLKPIVFFDEDPTLSGRKINGIKIFGRRDELPEILARFKIDVIILAVPTAERELMEYLLKTAQRSKCELRRFGNIGDVELSNAKISVINLEELLRRDKVKLNMETVSKFIKDKVVLVTGGAGSIGSELCRQALEYGCKHLIIYDINENGLFFIGNELDSKYKDKFSLKLGSIRDKKRLNEVFNECKPQIVFHAAAHKHVPMMELNPKEAIKNNVIGTINTAQSALMSGAEKFILISTDKAVNPANIMGASKRIAEMSIQMINANSGGVTEFAAVRFGNVLGSNGSVVPTFQEQISKGGPVTVTHKDITRYFMTIPEAVQLVLEAGAMAIGGEIFVLNMGNPVKIYDLACDLIRLSGLEPGVDIEIEITSLRPGEKLYEEINLAEENITHTDNDKIYVLAPLQFESTALAQSIKSLEDTLLDDGLDDMFLGVKNLVPTFDHKSNI